MAPSDELIEMGKRSVVGRRAEKISSSFLSPLSPYFPRFNFTDEDEGKKRYIEKKWEKVVSREISILEKPYLAIFFFGEPTPFFLFRMDHFSAPLHVAVTVIPIFEKKCRRRRSKFSKMGLSPFLYRKEHFGSRHKSGRKDFFTSHYHVGLPETEAAAASQFIVMQDGL